MSHKTEWIGRWCARGDEMTPTHIVEKEVTFAAATTGAAAAKELFTVTGTVICTVIGVCSTDLTGSGTICVGTSLDTDIMIGNATATAIDADDVFIDETQIGEKHEPISQITWVVVKDNDLAYEVKSNTITAGVINFYCLWCPVSDDADVQMSGVNTAIT